MVTVQPIGPVERHGRRVLLAHPERGLVAVDLIGDALRPVWPLSMLQLLGPPNTADFNESERVVSLATSDALVHMVDLRSGNESYVLKGPYSSLVQLARTADGGHLVGAHASGEIVAWELPRGQVWLVAPAGLLQIVSLGTDAAERLALAVDDDHVMTAWKLPLGSSILPASHEAPHR